MRAATRAVLSGIAVAAAVRPISLVLENRPLNASWTRTNFRDRAVSLVGGPTFAIASLSAIAVGRTTPSRVRVAALVAGSAAALAGSYDDLRGTTDERGLLGHLHAARDGRLTTGAMKVIAIGSSGLVAGCLVARGPWTRKLAAGCLIAGSANVANLLDLRPGRAAKFALLASTPLALAGGPGSAVAAAAAGGAAGLLPLDLGERVMLGDAGANTLGALVGLAVAAGAGPRRLVLALAAVVGLTAASEVVSFSAVIEANRPLRWFDQLGRRRDG
jgi:UDP-GlcNAc:undecaprenyl-phosphate/decaprenyl-phosphate GlcNAc-1-phosphate transferase